MKRIFFFDSHPPLGKQLLAAAAHLAGYNGNFTFDRIGSAYSDAVPITTMRIIPAFCGSLLVPLVYKIILQLKLSEWTATLAAILIIAGKDKQVSDNITIQFIKTCLHIIIILF